MADLIDRQAVQEMVDRIGGMYPYRQIGNRDSYSQYNEAWTDAINRVDAELNSLPSARPEIVRCGQCKYAEVADAQDNQDGYTCQFHRGSIWFSGSYCSWAERRTDDER